MPSARADDGTQLNYSIKGDGAQGVLFVHGWAGAGSGWSALLEHLDPTGLKIVVPDLRGAGESDKPSTGYTLDRYAKDVIAVADAAGLSKFTVVGHSMGGIIAQLVTANHPDRVAGQVLLVTMPPGGFPLPEDAANLFRNCAGNREMLKMVHSASAKDFPPGALDRLLDAAQKIPAAAIQEGYDAWSKANIVDKVKTIKANTLVVATDDPFLTPDVLRQAVVSLYQKARLAHLPGPGHYAAAERPRESAAIIQAFLAGIQ